MEPKPKVEVKADKPVRWKIFKGKAIDIPGLFVVTDANLNTPSILKSISMHEARTGHRLFGVVFVKA